MNGKDIEVLDASEYDSETHISTWCVLHVLGQRLCLTGLADLALDEYLSCRWPFWQGTWLPLPTEIAYLYQHASSSIRMRHCITTHFVSEFFSSQSQGRICDLASLTAFHPEFAEDVWRYQRQHLFLGIYADEPCGVEDCLVHIQWTRSEADSLERHPSATPELVESQDE